MKPLFSVLIPTYNRERHVCEAVESVLRQSWSGYEVLVIDDGSTDGTRAALARYAPHIRYLCQTNQGPEVARNNAAKVAQGEYLVFLDSDDLLLPDALQTYACAIESCDSPPLLIGSMSAFTDGLTPAPQPGSGSAIRVVTYRDFLSKDIPISLSNSRIVIHRALFEEIGGLRHTTPATFHLDDFNLILKAGTASPCVVVLQPQTVAYREHETNSIRDPRAMVDGILALLDSETKGSYPGGSERQWDRYACIGGISQYWIVKCLQAGKPRQAWRLLLHSLPMLLAAIVRKLSLLFSRKTPALEIDQEP